ncbi:MAG: putative toxin-antitoxin system toxin component, PIN family [Candidatus Verstraetearchaeota archaeon]|nr:putative toxin-antitoxin system toxin component, PIN family [Candidatus Verstraetearchaeota archaeon]
MGEEEDLRKIRVVFDANVLISAWFWAGNESRLVEMAEAGIIEGYVSPQILEEFKAVLEYPKFCLKREEVETACSYYSIVLRIVEPKHAVNVLAEDARDNKVPECAIEAKADYIVSGDQHLLRLREFKRIKIVKAKKLLQG